MLVLIVFCCCGPVRQAFTHAVSKVGKIRGPRKGGVDVSSSPNNVSRSLSTRGALSMEVGRYDANEDTEECPRGLDRDSMESSKFV